MDASEHPEREPEPEAPSFSKKRRWPEASRRTYFAQERTLLAWWRTGLATAAIAIALGGLLPKVSSVPRERLVGLALGYGVLALIFIIGGTLRERSSHAALGRNEFAEISTKLVVAVTSYLTLLIILTIAALI